MSYDHSVKGIRLDNHTSFDSNHIALGNIIILIIVIMIIHTVWAV